MDADRQARIALVVADHNAAISTLTEDQWRAVDRIVCSTIAYMAMGGKLKASVCLMHHIGREADGNPVESTIWDPDQDPQPFDIGGARG